MHNCRSNTAARRTRLKTGLLICAVSAWMIVGDCSALKKEDADDYSRGRAALRSGDYGKAEEFFASSLKGNANLEGSRAGLLQTWREIGKYREALKRAQDFQTSGKSAVISMEQGRLSKEIGDYAGAEKYLRECVALTSDRSGSRIEATRQLADLLEELGRRVEAERLWDQLLEAYRSGGINESRSLGNIAVAALRRGYKAQDAIDVFMDATDPARGEISLEALSDFGYLFLEKYRPAVALEVFRDCLKINPNYPPALLGIALAKKYESDAEVETYARASLKVNPNLTGALNTLAGLSMEEENFDGALQYINAALAVNPADLDALSLQAFCFQVRGDAAGFARIEKRVLEINPSCGRFYHVLADNLVSRRKYQEAVGWSRKAIGLDPRLWTAYVTLGMNLTRVGDLEGGRKAVQQAFDGDDSNVWAFNLLDLFDEIDTFTRSRSENFVFLMSQEDAPALSSYASELAEEVYAKLTRRYGFEPQGPLQVEIYPDHGSFAVRTLGLPGLSGALGVCFGKVVALDSPRQPGRETGSFNWGSTLWHEFVHVMTLQMSHYNIPRWYSEGLSVYEEHRARPGWGDNLTSAFLQAYKAGKLMKASELNAGFVRPQNPAQIMFAYYQSALVCEMIEEKYGFEKIRQSLLLFAENKTADEVFLQTLGLNRAQMDSEYAAYLDTRFKKIASYLNPPAAHASAVPVAPGNPDKNVLIRKLETAPDDFWANLQLGILLRKEGSNSAAETHLKRAQQLFPEYVEAGNPYQILGQMYVDLKRDEDALAQFNAWIHRDGNSKEPLLKAAEIYRRRADWDSAARLWHLSVFIDPYDASIQRKLGEAAMQSGKWPLAVAAFRTLAGLASDKAGAHYDLARALVASGKKAEAKKEVLRALESAPSYREAQELLLKLSAEAD